MFVKLREQFLGAMKQLKERFCHSVRENGPPLQNTFLFVENELYVCYPMHVYCLLSYLKIVATLIV